MEQSYIIWNGKSSKSFGYLTVEKVDVSAPAQKNKTTSVSNRDGSYTYTSQNIKYRPFFDDRFVTVSMYFKYTSLQDKTNKLSDVMNWLYNLNYYESRTLKILPDYANTVFTDAKIERFEKIEKASPHVMRIIIQIRCNPFTEYFERVQNVSDLIDFTDGNATVKFTNNGFYTDDFKIILTGGGNHVSMNFQRNGMYFIHTIGFTEQIIFDFKKRTIKADDGSARNLLQVSPELMPGENIIVIGSDGEAT